MMGPRRMGNPLASLRFLHADLKKASRKGDDFGGVLGSDFCYVK